MRKTLAIALLTLTSACAGRGDLAPMAPRHAIPGAMNAPVVLQARPAPRVKAPRLRDVFRDIARDTAGSGDGWNARVEYRDRIDRPDLLADASRNGDTARPAYATLQRSFGTGEFRPFVGVGIGQATPRLDAVETQEDGYTVTGVVGGNLTFSDKVGGYVQYDYAVASDDPMLTQDGPAHGLRFGLSIQLN